MPKLSQAVPKYRKHRGSGQAIVTLNGRDFYLGPHGSKTSIQEYDRLIGEWLSNGRQLVETDQQDSITVSEICARFWRHAKSYYGETGKRRGTANNMKPVLGLLRRTYGHTPAAEFGPIALKALRQRMVDNGASRSYANSNTSVIKRVFRWAASEQLISPTVFQALQTVDGLRKGRTDARETKPVVPVTDKVVDATLMSLPPIVRDMVRFQRLTGARPSEVCSLRPCDVDRSGDVWVYTPASHKTEHHGRGRTIPIGPKAQEIVRPYLLRPEAWYCFSPRESEAKRRELASKARKTPLSCGNRPGTNVTPTPKRKARERYTTDSYRRAIHRGVEKINRQRKKDATGMGREVKDVDLLPKWSPNQLRHAAATEIRRQFGLEAAQVVLGHAAADVTQVYAERDLAKAIEVARQVG